jgi:hypothetical protein
MAIIFLKGVYVRSRVAERLPLRFEICLMTWKSFVEFGIHSEANILLINIIVERTVVY